MAYKPKSKTLQRAQALAGLLLDTGLRFAEALALTRSDIDLDNLLIDVKSGKGRKQRKVPISLEGRRRLYLYLRQGNGLVNDPRFQQLAPWQMDLVMIKADPSHQGSSAYKLAMFADLVTRPPKKLGLSVTVKHHGTTYRASCSFSKLHYTDPDMPQEFANRDQPCGTLVSQYVGKTVPDWPSGGQNPRLAFSLVGMSFDPKRQKTLSFVARPNQREEYTEEYSIWSDDSPVSPVKE